ncbi:MAG: hypothetical protein HY549_01490 [Elusimicrobia bacterium]|nr:hypothetical protein [Elusimicrobiota bacterium]
MARNKMKSTTTFEEREIPCHRLASVSIEYPRNGETITHPSYTVQISAIPEAIGVEISIDGGEWLACRESLGLWWYDWERYEPGEHRLLVRISKDGGIVETSTPRRFTVILPS